MYLDIKNYISKSLINLKLNLLARIFYFKNKLLIIESAQTIKEIMIKISRLKIKEKSELPIHLAIGHENLSATISAVKTNDDCFSLTHRNIHFNIALSKIKDYERIINETLLYDNSINNGNYGCMTMRNRKSGIKYTSSILGNNISVGLGIASGNLNNSVTWIQTGDGAIEEGAFYEAIVFAKSRNLPVIFIIENNNWSLGSSIKERRSEINIKYLSKSLGIDFQKIKSINSIFEISTKIYKARKRALNNPQIIEVNLKTLGGQKSLDREYQSYHCGIIKEEL